MQNVVKTNHNVRVSYLDSFVSCEMKIVLQTQKKYTDIFKLLTATCYIPYTTLKAEPTTMED